MIPHAANLIDAHDLKLFEEIRCAVHALPEIDLGKNHHDVPVVLSCHILAQALRNVYKIESAHGKFMKMFDHSWLVTPCGSIIDVYPVGSVGGPVIYDHKFLALHLMFTRSSTLSAGHEYNDVFQKQWFEDAVSSIENWLHAYKGERGRVPIPRHSC